MVLEAIVLLGCRIADDGRPGAAAQRRAVRAAQAYHDGCARLIVAAGGRSWNGVSEAESLTRALIGLGVPETDILQEPWSLSTTENARCVAYLLETLAIEHIALVTCDWHMPRALHCFRRTGLRVEPLPAPAPRSGFWRRTRRAFRERLSSLLTRFAVVLALLPLLLACSRSQQPTSGDASRRSDAPPSLSTENRERIAQIRRAEATRQSAQIADADLSAPSAGVRRAAVRALARIADARSVNALGSALADPDPEVVSFAAYGLGFACRGREPETIRRLAMRAASLDFTDAGDPSEAHVEDPLSAIADALGRCGGSEAETSLRAWLGGLPDRAESAALGLGRLASAHARLDDASLLALLKAAEKPGSPIPSALYAFTRLGTLSDQVAERLLGVANSLLAGPAGRARIFAVRALSACGERAADPLRSVLTERRFSANEHVLAARGLAKLGDAGQRALLAALPAVAGSLDAPNALLTNELGPVLATLDALREARDDSAALKLATSPLPPVAAAAARRRAVLVRCSAARALARGRSLYPELVACDPDPSGRTGLLALVRTLGTGVITEARYARWLTLTDAPDPVVREAALELIATHPEIDAPFTPLGRALDAREAGIVATAAQILAAHPDRGTGNPQSRRVSGRRGEEVGEAARDIAPHPELLSALDRAFRAPRELDALDTKAALLDAAASLQLLSFKPYLERACEDPNPTLRKHAEQALRSLGDGRRRCNQFVPSERNLDLPSSSPAAKYTLKIVTDVLELELELYSSLAPKAVQRITELARAGFYDGMRIHRVVPGFVVQFGDPVGDGFGGAKRSPLPCETSPVHFEALDVGIALSGRDTGNSQIFVTFGPEPHLDGDYSWLGKAGPGWDRLIAGDVIRKIVVRP